MMEYTHIDCLTLNFHLWVAFQMYLINATPNGIATTKYVKGGVPNEEV